MATDIGPCKYCEFIEEISSSASAISDGCRPFAASFF